MMVSRTHNRRVFRILTILDEYTQECLSITVARNITARDIIKRSADLFIRRGIPEHICSNNSPKFTPKTIRQWLQELGVKTLYIEPGSPRENGHIESFNGKLRYKVLKGKIFTMLLETQVLIETWPRDYSRIRPHSALSYWPPVPEAVIPTLTLSVLQ